MARSAVLRVEIITDASKAAGGLGKFEGALNKAAVPAAAAGAAILAFGKATFDAASKAQQNMGAVDAVFGKSASEIHKWSKSAAESAGLSASAYEEMSAIIGAQLKNMGVPQKELAGQTNDLVKMGADLAAQFGGSTSDAVAALSSLLRGERDPIEKYGVSIKEADVKAQKAKMGLAGLTGAADKQATTMATMALLTQQTADANGAFAREADTAAGAQQRANAQYENAKAAIGQALLPLVASLAGMLGGLAKFAQDNATAFQILAAAILVIATAVLVVNAALKVYRATLVVVQAVQKAAFLTNPVFLIIAAVLLLVAAVVILWKKSETFRNIVLGVWRAIKTAIAAVASFFMAIWNTAFAVVKAYFNIYRAIALAIFTAIRVAVTAVARIFAAVWNGAISVVKGYFNAYRALVVGVFNAVRAVVSSVASFLGSAFSRAIGSLKSAFGGLTNVLTAPFDALMGVINSVIGMIQSVINKIKSIKMPSIDLNPFAASAPGATATATAGAMRAGVVGAAPAARAAGGGVSIVVNGALDPDAVARQIRRILSGHDRRTGGRLSYRVAS